MYFHSRSSTFNIRHRLPPSNSAYSHPATPTVLARDSLQPEQRPHNTFFIPLKGPYKLLPGCPHLQSSQSGSPIIFPSPDMHSLNHTFSSFFNSYQWPQEEEPGFVVDPVISRTESQSAMAGGAWPDPWLCECRITIAGTVPWGES